MVVRSLLSSLHFIKKKCFLNTLIHLFYTCLSYNNKINWNVITISLSLSYTHTKTHNDVYLLVLCYCIYVLYLSECFLLVIAHSVSLTHTKTHNDVNLLILCSCMLVLYLSYVFVGKMIYKFVHVFFINEVPFKYYY